MSSFPLVETHTDIVITKVPALSLPEPIQDLRSTIGGQVPVDRLIHLS